MRKICVVIGSRANYSSIKSVMRAVKSHPGLELQIVVGASALLERFGAVVDILETDGFVPSARVNMIIEGETPRPAGLFPGGGGLDVVPLEGTVDKGDVVAVTVEKKGGVKKPETTPIVASMPV